MFSIFAITLVKAFCFVYIFFGLIRTDLVTEASLGPLVF